MTKSMIFGKKQIVLCCLVMALGIAVYMNWCLVGEAEDFTAVSTSMETVKKYGDSQLVDSQNIDGGDSVNADIYFSEAKLTRQKTRDEAVKTLKNLIESDAVTPEQRTELALQTSAMATAIEKEGKIENLIKAKGFNECMVYYDTQRVDVIVKTNGLLTNEVAQMKDIIVKEVSVPAENIAIIEVN